MEKSAPDEEFRVTDRRRSGTQEGPEAGGAKAPPGTGERSLEPLFVMLGRSALLALGEGGDPAAGAAARDLAAAEALIDLLGLLREKTDGHRTLQESQLLADLIYDLQLRYVAASRGRS